MGGKRGGNERMWEERGVRRRRGGYGKGSEKKKGVEVTREIAITSKGDFIQKVERGREGRDEEEGVFISCWRYERE